MFKYGGIRLFLLKILSGLFVITLSILIFGSLMSYDVSDPGFNKIVDKSLITNFFGYFGAILSSIMLVFFGHQSYTISIFLFLLSIKLLFGFSLNKTFLKFLLIFISIILINLFISLLFIENYKLGIISLFFLERLDVLVFRLTDSIYLLYIIKLFSFLLGLFLIAYSFSINLKFIKKFKFIYIFLNIPLIFFVVFVKKFKSNKTRNKNNFSTTRSKNEPTLFSRRLNNNQTLTKKGFYKKTNDVVSQYKYMIPPYDFLKHSVKKSSYGKELERVNREASEKLEATLLEYGVEGRIVSFKTGPIVTLFEFVPKAGIKASKVIGLADDIARAMSSYSARIASQPGKTSIGIEIPNARRDQVLFGDLVDDNLFKANDVSLKLALGKDIAGETVYADLEKMPHLLIAGTTGSGKSVGINTMIMSLLFKFKPNECKLILIDPKMLELSIYEDIPHLLTPVVTSPNKAVYALKWIVKEMENRYKLMSSLNVKNIHSYNNKVENTLSAGRKLFREVQTGVDAETKKPIIEKREIPLEKIPLIVVVIDEMADLMMVAGKEVESLVQRLAQMARASGIHLITATQRPSVDVITGTIKANFPSRISYKVASKFDSRTILNEMGAEQLLGSGDMLFLENGANLKRLHGGYISEAEIEKVVSFIRGQATFDHNKEISLEEDSLDNSMAFKFENANVDELYTKAVNIVISQQKVSTSFIQRYLQIGYNRAARMVEKMEEEGVISEANNAGKRYVLKKK